MVTPPLPLTKRLKNETTDWHDRVEATPWVQAAMAGRLPREAYVAWARDMWPVYETLESWLVALPGFGPLMPTGLARAAALGRDLVATRDVAVPSRASAASVAYARRIDAMARRAPHRLVGHAYVRHLGDLAGGRILRRRFVDQWGEDVALAFYDFPDLGSPRQVLGGWRAFVDGLDLDEGGRREVIEEAKLAFAHNEAVLRAAMPEAATTDAPSLALAGV